MSNTREKPHAELRKRIRQRYLLRCILQGILVGIAGGLVVFELYFVVRGVPQSVIPYIGCAVFVPVFGLMYTVVAYRRIRRVVERFKGLVTWKQLNFDGFAVIRDLSGGRKGRRIPGWIFVTDKGFYFVPLARNDETYAAMKLEELRSLEPMKGGWFHIIGGSLNAAVYSYFRDEVTGVISNTDAK